MDKNRGLLLDFSCGFQSCLYEQGKTVNVLHVSKNLTRGRGEVLDRWLLDALEAVGWSHDDLEEFCVGIGPGSFTGLRVGIAYLQGLAYPRALPIFPFSSLQALRCSLRQVSESGLGLIPARKGLFYSVDLTSGKERLVEEAELSGLDSASLHMGAPLARMTHASPDLIRLDENWMDFVESVGLAKSGEGIVRAALRPNYLLPSAAEEKADPKP